MRDFLIQLIERPLSILQNSRRIVALLGVVFLSTFYLWSIVLTDLFASNESLVKSISLPLIPLFTTAVGVLTSFIFIILVGRSSRASKIRDIFLFGMLFDFSGYLLSGSHIDVLLYLYIQIGVSLLCIALLHVKLGRFVIIMGIASLVIPWVGIPLCNQVSACGTVEPALTHQMTIPIIVVQGYKGYNIILYENTYYAILQSEGTFSISKIQSGGYASYFAASTIQQVEQDINSKTS